MLAKLHVSFVIVGHSERRRLFGETDESVAAKAASVFRNGMVPIVCVGETIDEREVGLTRYRLSSQVEAALVHLAPEQVATTVVAYEPMWAIGTGQAATPDDAQEACGVDPPGRTGAVGGRGGGRDPGPVRGIGDRREHGGPGGRCPDVDGVLVGGASLDAASFVGIVRAVGGNGP